MLIRNRLKQIYMKKHLFTVILIFTIILNSAAKEYIHISVKDGLQSDYVTSLYRDTKGFMWIGTSKGLSRFDGVSMKQCNLLNMEGKPSYGEVRSIVERDSGEIIITSGKEVYRYNRANDNFVFVMQADHVLDCSLLAKGYYFAGSDLGLVVKNIEKGEVQTFLSREKVVAMYEVGDEIYILTPDNLYSLNISDAAQDVAFEFVVLHRADGYTFSAMAVEDEMLYIGTKQRGLYSFNIKNRAFNHLKNLSIERVKALCVKDKIAYVNQDNLGLVQYDVERECVISQIGHEKGSPMTNMSIHNVHADYQGLLWVGSFSNGLYLVQPKKSAISLLAQTESISVRSMWHISGNRFIIGSREGLYLYDNGITKHFTQESYDAMESNIILSVRPLKDNKYVIGVLNGGAFIVDEALGKVEPLGMDTELSALLSKVSVYGVEIVGDDIYFLTLIGLVRYSSAGEITMWNDQNSVMPSSLIFAHCYDRERNLIWLGTKKGFCKFKITTNSIERVNLISSIDKMQIANNFRSNMITMDSEGNILFDRDNNELLRYSPDTEEFCHINFAPNTTGHISGVVQDEQSGNMWIATTNDIYGYNEQRKQHIKIMEGQGFPSTNVCPNAMLKSVDGRAFVGTECGLYTFNTQSDNSKEEDYLIFISSITKNGANFLPELLKRSATQSSGQIIYEIKIDNTDLVKIDVVAPNFAKVNNYKYAFKVGDREWIYAASNRVKLAKGKLPLGSHKLHVMVTSSDSMAWSEPIYVGRIRVVSQMMMTFGVVFSVILLLGVGYIIMRRVKKQQPSAVKVMPNDGRFEQVAEIIKEALSTTQGYRNPTYRIKDLSNETRLPIVEISQVLNSYLGVNFTDFINDYRIEEMKSILLTKEIDQYNLHILAEQCGFNSKTSFYRIFKNKTGVTPLQYRKQHVYN